MRSVAIATLVVLAAGCAAAQMLPQPPAARPQLSSKECGVNLGKYMNMDPETFNDTLGKGWREIADKDSCLHAAADLLELYRRQRAESWVANLAWHEAQLRAASGETAKAIELFERSLAYSRATAFENGDDSVIYAEATIAFLRGDRNTLEAKRAQLAALPKPANWEKSIEMFKLTNPGEKPPIWPMNLNIVDGLVACFGRTYEEAYPRCEPRPN